MNPLFYGFRYLDIPIACGTAAETLEKLLMLIEARTSYVLAPIRVRDLIHAFMFRRTAKQFGRLSMTIPTELSLQRAVVKDRKEEDMLLSGKLFIDLMAASIKDETSLLICGTTNLEEIQLRDRFKLLLHARPHAIYISETMEKNHNNDQLITFIKKTNPRLIFVTWKFYKKFDQITKWLPHAVIFIFDIPLAIYTDPPARNWVLAKMMTFLSFFNIWKGARKLSGMIILWMLRKHRGNLKPL